MNDSPTNHLADLFVRAKRPVQEWKPEKPGDLVGGTVIDIDSIETKHGPAMCVTVFNDIDDTESRIAVFHDVLKRRFSKVPPEIDDLLVIQFNGKKQGQETDFYSYKVIHEDAFGRTKVAGNGKPAAPDLVPDVDDVEQPSATDQAQDEPSFDHDEF